MHHERNKNESLRHPPPAVGPPAEKARALGPLLSRPRPLATLATMDTSDLAPLVSDILRNNC